MKKISAILVVCMLLCANAVNSFAADVGTQGMTDEGLVTYSNDFEWGTAGNTHYSGTRGITTSKSSGTNTTFKIVENNGSKCFEMDNPADSGYPTVRINIERNDGTLKINSLANAKKYKVMFKLKYKPGAAKNELQMYCNGYWTLTAYSGSATGYNISCKNSDASLIEGAVRSFSAYEFQDYEIEVDKEQKKAALKINGNPIYENVGWYVSKNNPEGSILFRVDNKKVNLCLDDIKVIVTEPAEYTGADWQNAANIDFEDFVIGKIPVTEDSESNVGGFENSNYEQYAETSKTYVDYTYDDADASNTNNYLKIVKDAVGTSKPLSIKRNISSAAEGYSVYDVSFKIKNELESSGSVAFIRLGDAASGNSGAVVRFTKTGAVSCRDYSQVDLWQESDKQITPGEWTDVKIRVYRDDKKADLYITDMDTPVVTGFTTDHRYGGDYLVFAPQRSATGTISVDDIKITPQVVSDYTLTYDAGTADKKYYKGETVTAQCKAADEAAAPVVIIAHYDSAGMLKDTAISGEKDSNGAVSAALSGITENTGDKVSIMLWKSLNSLVPLKNIIELTPEPLQ